MKSVCGVAAIDFSKLPPFSTQLYGGCGGWVHAQHRRPKHQTSIEPKQTSSTYTHQTNMSSPVPDNGGVGVHAGISAEQLLNPTTEKGSKIVDEPAAAAVLSYLRKRGLGGAAVELQQYLDVESKRAKPDKGNSVNGVNGVGDKDVDGGLGIGMDDARKMELLEEKSRDMESALTLTTGGGVGYDLDAAPAIAKVRISRKDSDENNTPEDAAARTRGERSAQEDAKRYVESFTALESWVLSLPDEDPSFTYESTEGKRRIDNDSTSLQNLLNHAKNVGKDKKSEGNDVESSEHENASKTNKLRSMTGYKTGSFIPASVKPELIAVTFPLLVHTYCDLLENGLESSAATLLATYRHIHEPSYPTEFRDLDKCSTTDGIRKLNKIVISANDALSKAKHIRQEFDNCKNELRTGPSDAKLVERIEKYERDYKSVVDKHTHLLRKLRDYPFLKRVRSVKWHLNLSSTSFAFLARYLRSSDFLLPMSSLLQSRCHIIVESREPSPFVPSCILEDMVSLTEESDNDGAERPDDDVRWAAPVHPTTRSNELGQLEMSVLKDEESLPFPKYYERDEYETQDDYDKDKKRVAFNRAILSRGFRRLAAIEVKREYEVGMRKSTEMIENEDDQFGNSLEPSVMLSTLCTTSMAATAKDIEESGVELTCAKLCPPDGKRVAAGCEDSAVRIWSMESWTSFSGKGSVDSSNGVSSKESVMVLLGHKRGLPVFDIDWNRDGRTLISAGGDGSLRLWDTMAVGSYGDLSHVVQQSSKKVVAPLDTSDVPNTNVLGAKTESSAKRHGSALVCYQGHVPFKPIWSVSIAPCGYYFASAAADSTVRLWCTDRPTPVRVFTGHYSENVNCVSWHPNCNYVVSGSDDKTVRMWDVQSGNCVRMMSGCRAGVNLLEVSPSGQFVAGSDYSGLVHVWDLRTGRKVNEFNHYEDGSTAQNPVIRSMSFSPCGTALATGSDDSAVRIWDVRGLGNHPSNPEYAAINGRCATSQALNIQEKVDKGDSQIGIGGLHKTFHAKRTNILDLKYTKRNLLLSVGIYTPDSIP